MDTFFDSSFLFVCLYVSLGICLSGTFYRMARWFVVDIGPHSGSVSKRKRAGAAIKGMATTLFSLTLLKAFKVLLLDILFQTRILKTDFSRWIMHICIFFGFMMLLLMHALDGLVTEALFPDYYATHDPFQFLRNFFGIMVLFGVGLAIYRRIRYRGPTLMTRFVDRFAIILLGLIVVSGYLVESAKISSETVFDRMMEEYFVETRSGDEAALKAFWAEKNGTVFSRMDVEITPELLAKGKALNEESCAACHSPTKTAFVSFSMSKALRPVAAPLAKGNIDTILYYIHVLACIFGLAVLPFSKFFHLVTNPLTIMVNGLSDKRHVNADAAMLRRAMEIDACTDCGTCSRYCSVAPFFRMMQNQEILPMHKLKTVRTLSSGKETTHDALQMISEGAFICTACFKCTEVCPSGINLQDQWLASREVLSEKGHPLPHIWIKRFNASEWADHIQGFESSQEKCDTSKRAYYHLTTDSNAFDPCIQCQTCTNVCPVVAARTDLKDVVDITPQKIMNLLRLGLNDLALGSRMVWDCTTCYQCQENCPQGIKVTDIIYELKNIAYEHFKHIDRGEAMHEDV